MFHKVLKRCHISVSFFYILYPKYHTRTYLSDSADGDIYVEHLNTDHFYLSRSADIAMCYIYKVASTTFGRAFLKLESNSSDLKQFTRRQTLKPNVSVENLYLYL